jgi:signal transduction histidine kinase
VIDRPGTLAPDHPGEDQVVVAAPFGRDAELICQILSTAGLACAIADGLDGLLRQVRLGTGTALLTEEALGADGAREVLAALEDQPEWSDLPVVVLLAGDDRGASSLPPQVAVLSTARSVTIHHRPIAQVTLLTAIQASLRARRRQYEVRDLLARERAARGQAESAARTKDEFLAAVSHELQTPLSVILLWSQLIGSGGVTPEQMELGMRAITTSAQAQSRLVEDLIDKSRMLMGKLRLDVRPCAMGPIVQAAIEVAQVTADAKQIGLEVSLEACAAATVVRVDADRVQQIVWNLLNNAVKFTPAGGRVTIALTRDASELILRVHDNGEGIAADLLPHIFERFRQGHTGPTLRRSGLGLGLPIVQQLVELHGGTIRADSAGQGSGSTFTVGFPISVLDAAPVVLGQHG